MAVIPEDIISGCRRGKRSAQEKLYRLLAPTLMGVCYRYAGCREDAEDMLQESLILVFTKIDTFRDAGSFEGWARRITVNVALNWLKKNKKIQEQLELGPRHEKYLAEEDHEHSFPIETAELMKYIARLPDGYRTILNLFAIEGFSHKEIAGQLDINESTSRSQYTRARKLLIQQIQVNTHTKHER